MTKAIRFAAIMALLAPVSCTSKTPKTETEKVSYAIGSDIGSKLAEIKDQIDLGMLNQGMADKINGKESKMTPAEAQAVMEIFGQKMQQREMTKQSAAGEKNKAEGAAFLAKTKANSKVKATKSGLLYEVIKEGTGRKPKPSETVRVHYAGTLIDGTEFDSSIKRGQPAEFGVKNVIPGWTEALQLMPVGSKWRLVIPSNLAYGEHGAGGQIGPNAVLIFEVELLDILKK
ncbi:MAG: FKBP-type peptidyl-prolyl cis-trans isomerase [candidate division FCPU426 bacterium]